MGQMNHTRVLSCQWVNGSEGHVGRVRGWKDGADEVHSHWLTWPTSAVSPIETVT